MSTDEANSPNDYTAFLRNLDHFGYVNGQTVLDMNILTDYQSLCVHVILPQQ